MSQKYNGARVTYTEIIKVRDEIYSFLSPYIEDSILTDQNGNKNLLIPNNILEKNDNGDVDLFLYVPKNMKILIIDVIKANVLQFEISGSIGLFDTMIVTNFQSLSINKMVQVDIHVVENNDKILVNNHFNFYRVPQFFHYITPIRRFGIKLSFKGAYYKPKNTNIVILLDKDLFNFMNNIFNMSLSEYKSINSFKEISTFFETRKEYLVDFDITNNNSKNQKINIIRSFQDNELLYSNKYKFSDVYNKVYNLLCEIYELDLKLKQDEILRMKKKEEAEKRKLFLENFFNTNDINSLPTPVKKIIPDIIYAYKNKDHEKLKMIKKSLT